MFRVSKRSTTRHRTEASRCEARLVVWRRSCTRTGGPPETTHARAKNGCSVLVRDAPMGILGVHANATETLRIAAARVKVRRTEKSVARMSLRLDRPRRRTSGRRVQRRQHRLFCRYLRESTRSERSLRKAAARRLPSPSVDASAYRPRSSLVNASICSASWSFTASPPSERTATPRARAHASSVRAAACVSSRAHAPRNALRAADALLHFRVGHSVGLRPRIATGAPPPCDEAEQGRQPQCDRNDRERAPELQLRIVRLARGDDRTDSGRVRGLGRQLRTGVVHRVLRDARGRGGRHGQREHREIAARAFVVLGVPPAYAQLRNVQRTRPIRHDRELALAFAVHPRTVILVLRRFLVRIDVRTIDLRQLEFGQLLETQALRAQPQGQRERFADLALRRGVDAVGT